MNEINDDMEKYEKANKNLFCVEKPVCMFTGNDNIQLFFEMHRDSSLITLHRLY